MSNIIAGEPAPTNPTARETLHSRLFQFVGGATRDEMLDAYRAEVLANERATLRIEILTEVADLLMEADETAASLLVDRLLEGGA